MCGDPEHEPGPEPAEPTGPCEAPPGAACRARTARRRIRSEPRRRRPPRRGRSCCDPRRRHRGTSRPVRVCTALPAGDVAEANRGDEQQRAREDQRKERAADRGVRSQLCGAVARRRTALPPLVGHPGHAASIGRGSSWPPPRPDARQASASCPRRAQRVPGGGRHSIVTGGARRPAAAATSRGCCTLPASAGTRAFVKAPARRVDGHSQVRVPSPSNRNGFERRPPSHPPADDAGSDALPRSPAKVARIPLAPIQMGDGASTRSRARTRASTSSRS